MPKENRKEVESKCFLLYNELMADTEFHFIMSHISHIHFISYFCWSYTFLEARANILNQPFT